MISWFVSNRLGNAIWKNWLLKDQKQLFETKEEIKEKNFIKKELFDVETVDSDNSYNGNMKNLTQKGFSKKYR